MRKTGLKFIDLFAGIGAFHLALKDLGHECVFASELSPELQNLYKVNHGMTCHGDITKIEIDHIPQHDILCAGFPCQSFSKAGNQKGMNEARGKLFDEIAQILSFHKPQYFILENVRNIKTHNEGNTWLYIQQTLEELGYTIDQKIISPHHINIPQHRERLFIIGSRNPEDISNFVWLQAQEYKTNVNQILDKNLPNQTIDTVKQEALQTWMQFLKQMPNDKEPCKPLWSMEYNANYPIDVKWDELSLEDWFQYRGNYGYNLSQCTSLEEIFEHLPNYVKSQKGKPPKWKQNIIQRNRLFFEENKKNIDNNIMIEIGALPYESYKKLEWNCTNALKTYEDKLIQFRGSGIRIKKNDYLPSLVTVSTQIPIIGKNMRHIAPKEAARTQSLPENIILPETKAGSFRVLGNMVNITIVSQVAKELLKYA